MYNEERNDADNDDKKPDLFMQDFKYYKKLKPNDYDKPIESILYLDEINELTLIKFSLKVYL